jgi:alpha-L-rhamnosidase
VSWQRRGKGMTMALTVPANAAATVRLPASAAHSVREGGAAAASAPGVTVVATTDGGVVLAVGSGTYHFTSA